MLLYGLLGILDIAECPDNLDIRGPVDIADELAGECRLAVIDHGGRYVTANFISVDVGIEQRVSQGNEYYEDKYSLVSKHCPYFIIPYI